jgi:hypothetical protein
MKSKALIISNAVAQPVPPGSTRFDIAAAANGGTYERELPVEVHATVAEQQMQSQGEPIPLAQTQVLAPRQ